jgi:transcriptional regulator with XRE-family HTH domain
MSLESLADSINVTPPALQRLEAGVETLSEGDRWALIKAIADATRLPVQFFTVDFDSLTGDEPPEARLSRLEAKADETLSVIDEALARMDRVVKDAEDQMTRGKEQLDRFIAVQQPDRDLLRRIAAHLGIE